MVQGAGTGVHYHIKLTVSLLEGVGHTHAQLHKLTPLHPSKILTAPRALHHDCEKHVRLQKYLLPSERLKVNTVEKK